MAQATDVYGVIAGEAVSGTPQERWADMVHIASVISNRARMLGIPPEQVVANAKEFNAYGKDLPPGVDQGVVDMARQAMDYVQSYGPVTDSTFYSTPAAADGLPTGLSQDAATTGHQFYSDPQNRSIDSGLGFQPNSGELPSRLMTPFDNSPQAAFDRVYGAQQQPAVSLGGLLAPYADTYDPAMEPGQQAIQGLLTNTAPPAEVPSDQYGLLGPAAQAEINAQPTGYNRPFAPEDQVSDNIQAAVTSIMGPGASVQVTSGQEGGLSQFGSNRHKTGLAADVQITAPDGHVLSWDNPADLQTMKDIAISAGTQQANIGLGYNDPNMMHIDYVPSDQLSAGQDLSWGKIGNDPEFAQGLLDAHTFGTMPASFYDKAAARVVQNNVVPTLNSPAGITQVAATDSLSGVVNPIAADPVQMTDLGSPVANFADGYAAQRGPSTGLLSADFQAIQGNAERQLQDPASLAPMIESKPVPSYSEAMAAVPTQPSQPMSVETAMAMQTPNFNQAMNPTMPGLLSTPIGPSQYQINEEARMSQVPGLLAAESLPTTVEGPATTTATEQQEQQQAITAPTTEAAKPSLTSRLSKAINPGTIGGGLLGGLALGPAGGLVGGLLGNAAYNGNLGGLLGSSPMSINNIGGGLANTSSIWGGGTPAGTQATANDGQTVTSMGNGYTAITGRSGVVTVFDNNGKAMSYHGSALGGDPETESSNSGGGFFGGLFG